MVAGPEYLIPSSDNTAHTGLVLEWRLTRVFCGPKLFFGLDNDARCMNYNK
jgi:hypothetical protein